MTKEQDLKEKAEKACDKKDSDLIKLSKKELKRIAEEEAERRKEELEELYAIYGGD
jgi:hypothetical protein